MLLEIISFITFHTIYDIVCYHTKKFFQVSFMCECLCVCFFLFFRRLFSIYSNQNHVNHNNNNSYNNAAFECVSTFIHLFIWTFHFCCYCYFYFPLVTLARNAWHVICSYMHMQCHRICALSSFINWSELGLAYYSFYYHYCIYEYEHAYRVYIYIYISIRRVSSVMNIAST